MNSTIWIILFAIGMPIFAIASQVPQYGFNLFAAMLAFSLGFPLGLCLGLCFRAMLRLF